MHSAVQRVLRWGIQRSFVQYVRAAAGGVVECDGGAAALNDEFTFPVVTHPDPDAVFATHGAVHCTGHNGMLALVFASPMILRTRTSLMLTIADDHGPQGRLTFADLGEVRLFDGAFVAERPTLMADGVDLFFGYYPWGTPLDRVTIETSPGVGLKRLRAHATPHEVHG